MHLGRFLPQVFSVGSMGSLVMQRGGELEWFCSFLILFIAHYELNGPFNPSNDVHILQPC